MVTAVSEGTSHRRLRMAPTAGLAISVGAGVETAAAAVAITARTDRPLHEPAHGSGGEMLGKRKRRERRGEREIER